MLKWSFFCLFFLHQQKTEKAHSKKRESDDTHPNGRGQSGHRYGRLIQKIFKIDPLVRPKCQGSMKIIAFIEEPDIIEKNITSF